MHFKNQFSVFLFLFLAFAGSVLFTGCNKDNDPSPITKEKIVGLWKLDNYTYSIKVSGQPYPGGSGTDKGDGETVEFKADGKVITKDSDGNTEEGTWTLTGNKLTVTIDDTDALSSGTYEVKEATSSKLVVYQKESDNSTGIQMEIEVTATFKK